MRRVPTPGGRIKRTEAEKLRARDFVRHLGAQAGVSDPYDLASLAGLSRETVRGWWYGAAVPDGLGFLELLRAAGVVSGDYRIVNSEAGRSVEPEVGEEEVRRLREGVRKRRPQRRSGTDG